MTHHLDKWHRMDLNGVLLNTLNLFYFLQVYIFCHVMFIPNRRTGSGWACCFFATYTPLRVVACGLITVRLLIPVTTQLLCTLYGIMYTITV